MGPTTQWICDVCNTPIVQAADGWVEWIEYEDVGRKRGRDLRLVHHRPASPQPKGCQADQQANYKKDQGSVSDPDLNSFLGPDGLIRLLSILSDGEIPQGALFDLIQRLHIPGYEQARPYFEEAIARGVIEPNLPAGFYRRTRSRL